MSFVMDFSVSENTTTEILIEISWVIFSSTDILITLNTKEHRISFRLFVFGLFLQFLVVFSTQEIASMVKLQ